MHARRAIIRRGDEMDGEVVYGDIFFIINFSMDFLVLFSVSKILHLYAKAIRLTASSALGGAYSVAALFIENGVLSVLSGIAVSVLMCFIAFPKMRAKLFIKTAALFYGLSILLGGGVTAAYILLNKIGKGTNLNSDIAPALSDIPLITFLILAAVSFAAAYITGKVFGRQSEKKICDVTVENGGVSLTLRCLSDSGALIREPASGEPVIIVRFDKIAPCLKGDMLEALGDDSLTKTAPGMRIIPSKGVGGARLLCGFYPECVKIGGVKRRAVIAVVHNAEFKDIDGIAPSSLCI